MPSQYVTDLVKAIRNFTAEDMDRMLKRPRTKGNMLGISPLYEARLILEVFRGDEKLRAILQKRIDQCERGGLFARHCLACNTYYYSSATREGECRCTLEPAKM